jgi:hypothetical protein
MQSMAPAMRSTAHDAARNQKLQANAGHQAGGAAGFM